MWSRTWELKESTYLTGADEWLSLFLHFRPDLAASLQFDIEQGIVASSEFLSPLRVKGTRTCLVYSQVHTQAESELENNFAHLEVPQGPYEGWRPRSSGCGVCFAS